MRFSKWICLGVMAIIIGSATSLFADEAGMEQALSDRAQRVLDGVFGKGLLIPIVDVAISDPRYEVKYTNQSKAAVSAQKNSGGDRVQILPGYPVIKNLAPDNFKQLPYDSVTNIVRASIRSITVSVIVSQDFPRNQFGKVQTLLEQTLGMNPKRDKVEFNVQKFIPTTATQAGVVSQVTGKSSGGGANVIVIVMLGLLLVLLTVFVGVYVWMQLKQQQVTAALFSKQGKGGGGTGENTQISLSPMMSAPKADRASSGGGLSGDIRLSDNTMKHYFNFVNDNTIDKLQTILKREKMGVENLAVLVPCLPAHLAAKVLSELDVASQAAILVNMLEPKMFNKTVIEKFENQLRSAMECLIGGQTAVEGVLNGITVSNRKQLLATLKQTSSEGYSRIRPLTVIFDDLVLLDERELKYLLGVVNRDMLFTSLIGLDDTMVDRFVSNLSFGVRSMFKEFMELRSGNLQQTAIESAREQVLDTALQLEAEGKLVLKGRL